MLVSILFHIYALSQECRRVASVRQQKVLEHTVKKGVNIFVLVSILFHIYALSQECRRVASVRQQKGISFMLIY